MDASSDVAREAARRVGSIVGGCWHVDALLGLGGSAAVYAATHANGRRAAFKILRPDLASDRDLRERFLREAELARRIRHHGRVAIEGASRTDDGALMLVMELLEGETLEARWKRLGTLAPLEAFTIAEELLDFLEACHALEIVHRDLKPSNVFLTNEGVVKVLDLGIARESNRACTAPRITLGTPSFMAPEQARAQHDRLDGRADLFAVGAILYAVLTGRRLRRGRSDDELLDRASREAAPPIALVAPHLPLAAAQLVDRALAWDPAARYPNAAAMRDEVRAVCALFEKLSTPALARPTEPPNDAAESPGRGTFPETPRARHVTTETGRREADRRPTPLFVDPKQERLPLAEEPE
jgi:serine/threonine protein kinase